MTLEDEALPIVLHEIRLRHEGDFLRKLRLQSSRISVQSCFVSDFSAAEKVVVLCVCVRVSYAGVSEVRCTSV